MAPQKRKKTSPNRAATHNDDPPAPSHHSGFRETIESICVAVILALLFRAFVAEAFVIPTGSMAPTLMGAHKDLECAKCGIDFRIGASVENHHGGRGGLVAAGVCPNCRQVHTLNPQDKPNERTFSGDRILVSKFANAIAEPKRWDVIVFKYPGNPKQNYIKRLVGLPNEMLRIRHGDLFTKPNGTSTYTIARKPPHKLLAMSHLVYDSEFQDPVLIKADYPSRLQPWTRGTTSLPTDSWKIERSQDGLTASVDTNHSTQWLRYYHRWPTAKQRLQAVKGQSLKAIDPTSSRAITDFYSYDSFVTISKRNPPRWTDGHEALSEQMSNQFSIISPQNHFNGLHWVGDLLLETDIETTQEAKALTLEIVEAGVQYQCHIDLTTGIARLAIDDGGKSGQFDQAADSKKVNRSPSAKTDIRAGQRHRFRFSNTDDELLLWVEDHLVSFDTPTTFDASIFGNREKGSPVVGTDHPLDAAPVGIAINGGSATLHHFRLSRDKYYIATRIQSPLTDYDELHQLKPQDIYKMLGQPDRWNQLALWDSRRSVQFPLKADQFFPLGDNSPGSKDARCWVDDVPPFPRVKDKDAYKFSRVRYVPRDLLVGKAVFVFWPHCWNRPIPYWPNFRRMGLIR